MKFTDPTTNETVQAQMLGFAQDDFDSLDDFESWFHDHYDGETVVDSSVKRVLRNGATDKLWALVSHDSDRVEAVSDDEYYNRQP